jgi:uncharacterized phiE125 gp8 family phage protein
MKSLSLVSGATNALVTTAQAKDYLKVDISDDDDLIDRYVASATAYLEQYTNRAFLTSTWQLSLDESDVRGSYLELPRSPLASVTSVKYYESDGTEQTLAASNYALDTSKQPGGLFLALNGLWPTDMRSINAMVVEFTAGWGDAIGDVDVFYKTMVQTATLTLVAAMYDNRAGDDVRFATIPAAKPAKNIVASIRVMTI